MPDIRVEIQNLLTNLQAVREDQSEAYDKTNRNASVYLFTGCNDTIMLSFGIRCYVHHESW